MKKYILLILVFFTLGLMNNLHSQPPPPPPGGPGMSGGKGQGGNQGRTDGAPIGSANILLVTLAMLYGARKSYLSHKSKDA